MNKTDRIYIAGHRGMVGAALHRHLVSAGFSNLITRSSKELDLRDSQEVNRYINQVKPDFVFLAAAKVGGILANKQYPAQFIYDNLMIQSNVIHSAHEAKVHKLMFLGSSCIYPKLAKQPISEDSILSGPLEPTNLPYAIAKIAGITMCQSYHNQYGDNFVSVMPTSLYGPGDNYDLKTSHVLPALLRKFHEAKVNKNTTVEIWGTGKARREFMHVDDLAAACCFLMDNYDHPEPINIGTGEDLNIKSLATTIGSVVGYQGEVVFNTSYPDGTPRKLLDINKLRGLGWKHSIDLYSGIKDTYQHMKNELTAIG